MGTLIALLFIVFMYMGIGLYVYFDNSKKVINKIFAGFTFIVAIWALVNYLENSTFSFITEDARYFFLQADFVLAPFIALFFWFFIKFFPKNPTKNVYPSLAGLSILTFVLSLLALNGTVIRGFFIEETSNAVRFDLGPLFPVYALFLLILMFGGLVILFKKFISSRGIERSQIKYIWFGLTLSIVISLTFNLFLQNVLPLEIYRLQSYALAFFIFFTAYAIVAHRLFDIRVIIKRTVVFAGLSLFVLGTYIVIIFSAATLLGGGGSAALASAQLIPNLVAALGIALGFEPLRKWLTVRTDKWLFKGEYTPDEILRSLADTLANVIDLDEALDGMIRLVVKSMRLTKGIAFIIQPGENDGEYELKRAVHVGASTAATQLKLAPKDSLIQYFLQAQISKDTPAPVVTEELLRLLDDGLIDHERAVLTAEFIKRLTQFGGALALPLFLTRQQPIPTPPGTPVRFREVETLVGVLVLGEKKSGDAFTDQDLRLLGIVSSQTAAAVEKARFFEEDQLKSEFVSIASHELLTPTAAMEGYLSMILEEGMGKVDPQAKEFLERVFAESKRLASLVKDLLNVSRIERGKIVVSPQAVELVPLVTTTVENLQLKAKERGLKLILELPKAALPKVMTDPEKLTEVLMNIIGNGLKYTAKGTVTVAIEQKGAQVLVHTKDSGIGIKPEDQQHLFTKFFRASNSDQTGQGGTGLGLYITKHVIELMGGTLAVTSELGKGSTFTFSLPVAK